jgi:hypothetical protein
VRRTAKLIVLFFWMFAATLWSHNDSGNGAMGQRANELKSSIAANQAKLHAYQWTQTTQVSLKGETKKSSVDTCRYGPDGQVQKTPVGSPAEFGKPLPTRGIKGKIAQKRVGEMQDYTERLKSLVSHYAPPNPDLIQNAIAGGRVSLNVANGVATITFTDYYKAGDKAAFALDVSSKKLQSYDVHTYLDDPKKDIVTLTNRFATLPDGTNYVQQTILDAEGKQLKMTTTNDGYVKIAR